MRKFISVILAICSLISLCSFLGGCKNDGKEVSTYEITATYDSENRRVTGIVEFTFVNSTDNSLSDLKFNLYGNAYREGAKYSPVSLSCNEKIFYSGKSFGSMQVNEVSGCSGWNVGGEDENILTVTLLTPVYPAEKVKITINYTLNLAYVNHRTGVAQYSVNLGNFYPILCAYSKEGFIECNYYSCGDPFVSECADYIVNLDLPKGYVAATSGKTQKESSIGDRVKRVFVLENARDFAIVFSDKFKTLSENVDGTQVTYFYYSDADAQNSLRAACDSLKYFSNTFGKYAYPTLCVVQTGFCHGGMEYPGLTMISDYLDKDSNIYTIVHENAHQWWYAMVGNNQLNSAWQDEGLAEYSTLMFFEKTPIYAFTKSGLIGNATKAYRAYYTVYKQIFGNANTTMNRHLKDYENEYEYNNIAYRKGLIMFDMLRNSIGDEKFISAIKKYFDGNLNKIAAPEDLISSFINCGNDIEGFFSSFIEGKIVI